MLKRKRRKIGDDAYCKASFELMALFRGAAHKIADLDTLEFTDPPTFCKTQDLCKAHGLDLSDAFQILSVKTGTFSALVGDSQTVLVTGDRKLACAARQEGLKVWHLPDPPPT